MKPAFKRLLRYEHIHKRVLLGPEK